MMERELAVRSIASDMPQAAAASPTTKLAHDADDVASHGWNLTCDICHGVARVHILHGYQGGEPVYQTLCLPCADHAPPARVRSATRSLGSRLGLSGVLVIAGLIIGTIAVLADEIAGRAGDSFGWIQLAGVTVGILCVLMGALLHVDAVGVAGGIAFIVAASADVVELGRSPGVGLKQLATIMGGILLILVGLLLRLRRRRQSTAQGRPTPGSK